MTMRIRPIALVIATVSVLGTPALVQVQAEKATSPAQSSVAIRSIKVVDVRELQPEVRSTVDAVVAHTSQEDMQSLRKAIDDTPEAVSALKEKGLNSSQVVAINIVDGVLTMFARTA
jgi:hypothetical protein